MAHWAKIISTNVSIPFLRGLDDWRVGVSRDARVYRPACVHLESGLDRRELVVRDNTPRI